MFIKQAQTLGIRFGLSWRSGIILRSLATRQLTNAADSIASEHSGRDTVVILSGKIFNFVLQSVLETKNWLQQCEQRGLIRGEEFEQLLNS